MVNLISTILNNVEIYCKGNKNWNN